MNWLTLGHALLSTFFGVLANIAILWITVWKIGDDTAKGTMGLYWLLILNVPFLLIITWPLAIVLFRYITTRTKALVALYGIVLFVALLIGLIYGLSF
jgi:hypothetical protein